MSLSMFSVFGESVTHEGMTAVSALLLLIVAWATKKYLVPLVNTGLKKKMAEYVLLIADEVTDQLAAKHPKNEMLEWLDQAVDKIMEITGVSRDVATRAAQAALGRKGIKPT
jgi:hypothetical protein